MSDTGIDGCISKINDLRENAGALPGLLAPILDSISNDRFLRRDALEQAIERMRSYSGLMESLEAETKEISPEIRLEGGRSEVLEALEKLKAGSAESAMRALEKFQKLNISDPEVREALTKCQKTAADISEMPDSGAMVRDARPYRVFMDIFEGKIAKNSLTGAQYQSVNALPYPLPLRLLTTGEFFIDEAPAAAPAEPEKVEAVQVAVPADADGVQTAEPEAEPAGADGVSAAEPVPAADGSEQTGREPEYTYTTMKLDKPASIKAFKSYIANQKTLNNVFETIDLIQELSWCIMVSENQLRRFFPKTYQRIAESLFKEGYLTRIEKKSTHDKYYSLSYKGCHICRNEEIRTRVKRSHGLIARPLITGDDLREEEGTFEEMAYYNDFAIYTDRKLRHTKGYRQFDKKVYNKLPGKIYSRLALFDYSHNKNALLLPSSALRYFDIEDLDGVVTGNNGHVSSTDTVILYVYDKSAVIDPEKLARLKTRRLYYIYAEDIAKEKFRCKDVDGVEHEADILFEKTEKKWDPDDDEEGEHGGAEDTAANEGVISDPVESTDDKQNGFEEGIGKIIKLLAEKRIMEAAVLAKAYTFLPPPEGDLFKTFYWRLSYAVNMRMDLPSYTSVDIDKLEEDEFLITGELLPPDTRRLLRLSTFAWALLLPRDPYDHKLYQYKDSALADAGEFKETVPSLKTIFDKLFGLIEILPQGFNFDVMAAFIDKNNLKDRVNSLVNRASQILMLSDPSKMPHVGGTPEWYRACLGNDSELAACVKIMAGGDQGNRNAVKAFLEEYDSETHNPAGKYLEKKWNEVKSKVNVKPKYAPDYAIESGLSKKVKEMIDIIRDWWSVTGSGGNNIRSDKTVARARNELMAGIIAFLKKAAGVNTECGETLKAGLAVIENTLSRILRYLEDGTDVNGKWDYIELLRSYHVSLSGDSGGGYIPALNATAPDFEPWLRAMAHMEAEKLEFNKAWDLITNAQGAEPDHAWFKNYGSARIIEEYLESKGEPAKKSDYRRWMDTAREMAELDREKFRKDINFMYVFYGRVEKSDRDSILETLDCFNGYFFEETKNFAQYAAFIKALRRQIDSCSDRIGNNLETEFNALKGSKKIDDSIIQKVYDAIEARNFNIVRYIMGHIEKNDINSIKSEIGEERDRHAAGYLKKFMEGYGRFHTACRKHIHEEGLFWATKHVTTKEEMKNGSARKLLATWPKIKSAAVEGEKITELLGSLGFKVEEQPDTPKEQLDDHHNRIITVYIESGRKNSDAYVHPVARFGTEISRPVNVCLLAEESSTPTALKNFLTDNKLADSTLILADKAYKLEQRAELARLLRSEIPGTFLIIDRVLLLYLATLEESERLPALLQCTLPYAYCQPYMKESGGPVADEMFFGREDELRQIKDVRGVHLICGEKHLGKTALLKRACNLDHDPGKGEYAVFVDVKGKGKKDALPAIYGALKSEQNGVIDDAGAEIDTTKKLCDALAKKLSASEISKIRIYVDGADRYLEDITSDDYGTFVRLRDKFPGRFKLVFAGQDSAAAVKIPYLRIKPFPAQDARKLLETPLAYLGFQLSGDDLLTILSCTDNYPGLLHQCCHAIIEAACKNHEKYCGGNPPFVLDKDRLSGIFDDAGLYGLIKDFFNGSTLDETKNVNMKNIVEND